jgi:hypothetical protein
MMRMKKTFWVNLLVVLMLAGAAVVAQGQVPGGGSSFGGSGRGLVIISGHVMCAPCSLDEARKAQPNEHHLYQLTSRRNQLVMKMTAVNEAAMFDSLAWPPRLAVRGPDHLLDRLGAEENLFKEMTITGLLHSTRTLDVFDVAVKG